MEKLPKKPTVKNPPERFTGDVWLDMITEPQEGDQRAIVAKVRFAPCARTAWHSHPRGQFLHVTEGKARMGTRDGKVIEVRAGETVYTPPNQDHWHGAAPDSFMEHLAMSELGDDGAAVWLEHVTDEQYNA